MVNKDSQNTTRSTAILQSATGDPSI